MRLYLSLTGIRSVELSTDELLYYYTNGEAGRKMEKTQQNVALFRRVIDYERVLLRDPLISIEQFTTADFIVNRTEIFIQSMPKQADYTSNLILSHIKGMSSIGLSLYVYTVNRAYIDQLHRNNTIDEFLKANA